MIILPISPLFVENVMYGEPFCLCLPLLNICDHLLLSFFLSLFLSFSDPCVTDILIEVYGVSRGFDGLFRSLRCNNSDHDTGARPRCTGDVQDQAVWHGCKARDI